MKFNNKQIQSRAEKIQYLKGLQNKTRKLDELSEPLVIMLEYRDDHPDYVFNRTTGKHISVAEAQAIKKRTYKNTLVWSAMKTYFRKYLSRITSISHIFCGSVCRLELALSRMILEYRRGASSGYGLDDYGRADNV